MKSRVPHPGSRVSHPYQQVQEYSPDTGVQRQRPTERLGPLFVVKWVASAVPHLNWELSNSQPVPQTSLQPISSHGPSPRGLPGHWPFPGSLQGLPRLGVGPSLLRGQCWWEKARLNLDACPKNSLSLNWGGTEQGAGRAWLPTAERVARQRPPL